MTPDPCPGGVSYLTGGPFPTDPPEPWLLDTILKSCHGIAVGEWEPADEPGYWRILAIKDPIDPPPKHTTICGPGVADLIDGHTEEQQ